MIFCLVSYIGKYEFKAHSICSEVFSFVLGPAPLVPCAGVEIAVNNRDA